MNKEITVIIPSIPPRSRLLARAVKSVLNQTYENYELDIIIDSHREGPAKLRNRAIDRATTPWVAFLDDDDEFMPKHLMKLIDYAYQTGADYVFPWFTVVNGSDPFPMHFGKKYDTSNPTLTTITMLVRTDLAQSVKFTDPVDGDGAGGGGEDWDFTLRCIKAGAKIEHLPERTWYWHHHVNNTSGRTDRW